MRLSGKVIIVTGSSTGIGEAIARRAVAEGARVVVHGRDAERTKQIAGEFETNGVAHVDDLADPAAGERLVAAALKSFGQLDAVVNNAAYVVRSDLTTTDAEFFDRVMAVNLRAPLLLIRAAMPELVKTGGCVLNIGSVNGYCGESNLLAYSLSKGGLMTLSRNLADAWGPRGVRVNHINPGWVLTPNELKYKIADGLPPNWAEEVTPDVAPSGRLIVPEEIAAATVYWLSDESRPISGAVFELEQYPVIGRNPVRAG